VQRAFGLIFRRTEKKSAQSRRNSTPFLKTMKGPLRASLSFVLTSTSLVLGAATASAVDFVKDIQPIFETKCLECHNPKKVKGDLLMDTAANLLKGGEGGAGLVVGKPDESEIVKRMVLPHDHDDIMPPKGGPLPEAQVALIKQWINEGAVWPQGLAIRYKSPEEVKALAQLQAKLPALQKIEILPGNYSLETKRDSHRVIVMATFNDATTKDVTGLCDLKIADSKIAKLEDLRLSAVADSGSTELIASVGGQTVKAAVTVKAGQQDRAVSFRLDCMPVFMRGGCNQGGCHGAARGKDGFRTSLFGMDPAGDFIRLTREMPGRRINLAIPEESALIEKAVGAVPHSGNQCFEPDSPYNKVLIEWIANGAQDDKPDVATCTGIEIFPKQFVMEGSAATQQITVRATYSDGTDRDVTNLALFMSNNDPTASIDKGGLVTSGDRGEAFMLARFNVYSVVAQVLSYAQPQVAEAGYIDKLVNEKLHKLRIVPSGLCTDEEFVRRVHIDIAGIYPEAETVRTFLADKNPNKRAAIVDTLLERKEFTEMWVMKFAELLQIRSSINNNQPPFYKNALLYYNWLSDKIGRNVPLNQVVIELLGASGGTVSNPPVNFYQTELDQLKLTENVAQVFMGMRIQCAQCHNHPFDRWTMDDYYGFKAFFSQIGRKQTDDPQEVIIYNSKGGESRHFLTQAVMKPKFLGGETPEIKPGDDRRKVMAEWLASPRNPYFARNFANIIWAHFTGTGIVEPVDDVRVSNPPSNPELLTALADKFTTYNYDFRKLVRDICTSATYQRTTKVNESNANDKLNFSHAKVRRVRAEVLLDAISQITETPNKFQGLPLGARAVQIADGATSTYFLTTFGRAKRESVCSCEVKMEPTLSQALHLMNGDAVNDRIKQGRVVAKLITEKKNDREIAENLFLRVFGRLPNEKEWGALQQAVSSDTGGRQTVFEDLFWALLNSKEFFFNH
jgi:mono/diheme cytochrome c family protein